MTGLYNRRHDVSSYLTISVGAYFLEPNDLTTLEEFYQKADRYSIFTTTTQRGERGRRGICINFRVKFQT